MPGYNPEQSRNGFVTKQHEADICVVGGGLAGICAAIAAAREGARVVIMQDRPMFGGNASSEIRMWVCGAHGENKRETGIIEELELENIYRNPSKNYSIWDSVLYEKVFGQKNLTALLNCSCLDAQMDGASIASITGWQLSTQQYHRVNARIFIDCSGDSVLAPLTGALFRVGREARDEFDEDIEPEEADETVMGMSILLQARETAEPTTFVPPAWAYKFPERDDIPFRETHPKDSNYWWVETGGLGDTIGSTEEYRDELLKIAYGVWDHVKNGNPGYDASHWELDWVGFLPGKRESRRYVGDYMVNQRDVRAGGPFEDVVAYAGWSMDDHHPSGFWHPGEPTIFHPAPSPWRVPYRSLYSKNIDNLMFAGRNISVSHIALSSSRVMRTCAVIGQAAGTAAAMACKKQMTPREVGQREIAALQARLMEQDCWLPGKRRACWDTTAAAKIVASGEGVEELRSGVDRPTDQAGNCWDGVLGSPIEYRFDQSITISRTRIVFDSNLARYYRDMRQRTCYEIGFKPVPVASEMVKSFRIEFLPAGEDTRWTTLFTEDNNYQRLYRCDFEPVNVSAVRLVPVSSWGNERVRIFSWDIG